MHTVRRLCSRTSKNPPKPDASPGGLHATGPLVLDLFNGAATTLLTAHTPDEDSVGGGWSFPSTGTLELDGSGGIVQPGTDRNNFAVIDCGQQDALVTVNGTLDVTGSGKAIWLMVRYTDINNYYLFQIAPGGLRIYRVLAGGFTQLAFSNPGGYAGAHQLRLQSVGTAITAWFDATQLSATDSSHSGTVAGLKIQSDGSFVETSVLDDFEVVTA